MFGFDDVMIGFVMYYISIVFYDTDQVFFSFIHDDNCLHCSIRAMALCKWLLAVSICTSQLSGTSVN